MTEEATTSGTLAGALVGVDVGGTFTDFACILPDGQRLALKVPSTPADPSRAVLNGLERLVTEHGIEAADVSVFAHGTTVATNAVLERKGATLGLLTTEGFRDTLEIGRQMRQQMYSVRLDPETPIFLAPGRFRRGVPERVDATGAVIQVLDETALLATVADLVEAGIESLAIAFLFSFLNPTHERRAAELISERWPDLPLSLSCEVDPAFREYERTVVTTFDAYIKPVINRYLERLEAELASAGVPATLRIMQSRGGLSSSVVARERPVRLFLSGPAAGVIGGRQEGIEAGITDLITVDIGGTSCDIALISQAKPMLRHEGKIDGYAVRVPMVDVNAIGSGGGSIAWIDGAGGLRVGPHSAGSDPGPACYGRGGEEATVTDASLVLGLLDPDYFAGGGLALDPNLAREVLENKIAEPLGLTVEQAALGIHRVLNAQMAEGIRLVSVRQGYDPRDFTLLGLGGAGALHAAALAEELGVGQVLVPRRPGVLSAAGLLAAPVEHEVSTSFARPLADLDLSEVRSTLGELDQRAEKLMAVERIGEADVEISYAADVCYIGQSYHLEVPLEIDTPDPLDKLYRDFLVAHDRVYGHSVEGPARMVNLHAVHWVQAGEPTAEIVAAIDGEAMPERQVLTESGPVTSRVLRRAGLAPGETLQGPVVVEQADTTVWIPPRWRAEVLDNAALLLRREGA